MKASQWLLSLAPLVVAGWNFGDPLDDVPAPVGTPGPAPEYAKNNINNLEGVAPDKGVLDGPVLEPLNKTLLAMIHDGNPMDEYTGDTSSAASNGTVSRRDDSDYWLPKVAGKGIMPLAPAGYQFYRDIRDFGATGDGETDDTAAINRAVAAFSKDNTDKTRCGKECGSSTTLQALVYFPPGTYLVSSPIIQYYHTQFVGNAITHPVLKGSANFSGIAIVDNDVYIPNGNGAEWYINQSNFLRQIRNIDFDLTAMKNSNRQGIQRYTPTGIHWQVGQATSITNCKFTMPVSTGDDSTTAVGIFMENGSGGTMSGLSFYGGNIGIIAGSQQFTAVNLSFVSVLTGIKQLWNWGFVYKNVVMFNVGVGFDLTAYSTVAKQGVGSIALLDSDFIKVSQPMIVGKDSNHRPSFVLDKIRSTSSGPIVSVSGGETVLGPGPVDQWISGYEVLPGDQEGSKRSGKADPYHPRPEKLTTGDVERYFYKLRPNYDNVKDVTVVTDKGVKNDGTGDQTAAINKLLAEAQRNEVFYFPAGIYQVKGTVKVPAGSVIVGSSWSQIQGTGSYFEDANNPKVMVQVGVPGEIGLVEISDMLFTVKGPTAGCILMQWNIRELAQGSASMWDSHFRVGGAEGSGLQTGECPAKASSVNEKCQAASMMLHMTKDSSGYFDNVWAWVADHDLDNPANAEAYETDDGIPRNVATQVSVYSARGILIESRGPTWFYGSSSEHSQMYQYQVRGAKDIFFGHMQTETPYYQPNPTANSPYLAGAFHSDPTFLECKDDDKLCQTSWALRIIDSRDIVVYGGGFYSFFKDNELGCTDNEDCQKALVQTSFSQGVWLYNIFTKGNQEVITPAAAGHLKPIKFDDKTRNGYTSEVAAWLPLALEGADWGDEDTSAGSDRDPSGDGDMDDTPFCDFEQEFDSLEAIAEADDLDPMCRALLALPFLIDKLDRIYDNYTEINAGYDDTFKYYEKYFRYVTNQAISNCTKFNNDLFRCKNYEYDWKDDCQKLAEDVAFDSQYQITWDCKDKPKYEDDLDKLYAVNNTWLEYGETNYNQGCHNPGGAIDWGCEKINQTYLGWPQLKDHIDVPDPKDVIEKAGPKFQVVKDKLYATYADMLMSQWGGSYEDALDVFGVPVGVLEQAVQSMKDDKQIGEKIHDQEVKAQVINILSIVFSLLPFVDVFGPIGPIVSLFGRIAALVGELGTQALNIYNIYENKETAPLVIISALSGLLGVKFQRSGKGLKDLRIAKDLADAGAVIAKYGRLAKANNALIAKIVARCR